MGLVPNDGFHGGALGRVGLEPKDGLHVGSRIVIPLSLNELAILLALEYALLREEKSEKTDGVSSSPKIIIAKI